MPAFLVPFMLSAGSGPPRAAADGLDQGAGACQLKVDRRGGDPPPPPHRGARPTASSLGAEGAQHWHEKTLDADRPPQLSPSSTRGTAPT